MRPSLLVIESAAPLRWMLDDGSTSEGGRPRRSQVALRENGGEKSESTQYREVPKSRQTPGTPHRSYTPGYATA
jgi:hypothetical protein